MTATVTEAPRIAWVKVSGDHYVSPDQRFTIVYANQSREWVAMDCEVPKKAYGCLSDVQEWAEKRAAGM